MALRSIDGKLDIIFGNEQTNLVSVLRNTSSGIGNISFASRVDFGTGTSTQKTAVGDIDGDGKPEIVVTNWLSNTVSVFRNTCTPGTISFAAKVDFATGTNPFYIAIADYDGDGKSDLAVPNYSSNNLYVFRNNSSIGSISFVAPSVFAAPSGGVWVAAGDIDGDGKPDITLSSANANSISVFRNTSTSGSISLAARVDFPAGTFTYGGALGDLTGDGKPDVAVANYASNNVSIFPNTSTSGSISFGTRVDFNTNVNPFSTIINDLDGDNLPDVAVTNTGSNNFSIFKNASFSPAITSFTPTSGTVGTLVTITGTNLSPLTSLSIGGVAAVPVSNDGTTLVAMVMPGATTGTVSVTTGGGSATSSSSFTVTTVGAPNTQMGGALKGGSNQIGAAWFGRSVALSADGNMAAVGAWRDNSDMGAVLVYTKSAGMWVFQSKLVGTGGCSNCRQGTYVAMSADGTTVFSGEYQDITQEVFVFRRTGTTWSQEAMLPNPGGERFGCGLTMSADGNTAAIGGFYAFGNQGRTWVYTRSGSTWSLQQTLSPSNFNTGGGFGGPLFGHSNSLSADGNTLAVGAYADGDLIVNNGATYIFTRSGATWSLQTKITPSGFTTGAGFGNSVSLSADGNTLASGAPGNNNPWGAVLVYTRSGIVWSQEAFLTLGGSGITGGVGAQLHGSAVSLSADGNTLVEAGHTNNSNVGSAWVFRRSGTTWTQQNINTGTGNTGASQQGYSVCISSNGQTMLSGGHMDDALIGAAWTFYAAPPTLLSATVTKTNNICNGECAGTATVTAAGGAAPYTYLWSNGQTTQTATGLCYGAYNVVVTDVLGNTKQVSFINITQPSAISVTRTITNATCSTQGSISVVASGGTGAKTFLWSTGATTASITGLNGATYGLTVTDAAGCQKTFSYFVDDLCYTIAITKNNIITCVATCTGDATVTATDGVAPYTYQWSNGQTTSTATGLCRQNYRVTVTDANNIVRIGSVSIAHSKLDATYTSTNTTCNGNCDGTATIFPTGAQAPYTFVWNSNAGNQTTQTATGLCYTAYNVSITSANGCTTVKQFINVYQNPAIAITVSSTPASCANDGTAMASATGGVAPLTYAWSNGGNTADIASLAPGTYTVTVTDANGCMKTKTVTVGTTCGAKPTENGDLLAEESILDESMPTEENIDINETLRLNDFTLVDAFNVYPNPNNGLFTIDIQLMEETDARLRIHDVLGRTLLEQNLQGQSFQVAIDAKTWTSGAYFVQLISADGQTTRKVLISNE